MTPRTLVLATVLSLALESTLLGQNPAQTTVEIAEDSAAATDSFGLVDQHLFVPALDFHRVGAGTVWLAATSPPGFWYAGSGATTIATLRLPAGGRIDEIVCYFLASANDAVSTTVDLVKHHYDHSSNVASVTFPGPTIESVVGAGVHTASALFIETVRYRVGNVGHFYQVRAEHGDMGFRGCNVVWHRQVSTAPTSATFSDVPVGHPYHRFVEALANSGITAGCGGGNYCVNNPITRGEMAVFLAAALGLHFSF